MLEELQSLDPAKKKQVLIVATIIIMIIVIGIWFTYFNSIVVGTGQQPAEQATSTSGTATAPVPIAITPATATTAQANGPSLWQNIENGFSWIGNLFRRPSQYNIQPQSN